MAFEGRFTEEHHEIPKIDLRDKKILALLSENSRRPVTEIAKCVRISADVVRYRIRRLERLGVIQRHIPIVNFKLLNYYVFHVFMLVDESDKQKKEELLNELRNHEAVLSIIEYSDRWDLEVTVLAKTLTDFDAFITDLASKYAHIILEKNKLETIKNYNLLHFPIELYQHVRSKPKSKYERATKIDAFDLKVLGILAEDASLSNYDIGRKLQVSSDTVAYRIKKLTALGLIMKFTVLVNLSLLNFHWYTFCIQVKVLDKKHDSKFKEFVHKFPNILRACKTLGDWDLLLYIVAQSPKEFHSIVKEIKDEFSDIIRNYQTWVAYKEHSYCAFPRVVLSQ